MFWLDHVVCVFSVYCIYWIICIWSPFVNIWLTVKYYIFYKAWHFSNVKTVTVFSIALFVWGPLVLGPAVCHTIFWPFTVPLHHAAHSQFTWKSIWVKFWVMYIFVLLYWHCFKKDCPYAYGVLTAILCRWNVSL